MTKRPFRFILFFLICLSMPLTATAQVVSIPDLNLRAVIEKKLGKAPDATITVAAMAWITDLDGTNRNIHNLTGLEYATNLIRLWLPENNITDLRPLSGLTQLEELGLWTNFISDISPLARLVNLRGLYLRDNYIFDLSPLAGLTQLRYLNLGENRIFNILFLRGLTQLEELGLWTNSISDISPLARLTNLRLLDLGENAITSISALAGLINLSKLWIDNNSISDLWSLVANTGLRSGDFVDVRGNPLSTLSFNTHIPTLQSRGVNVAFDQIVMSPQTVNIPDPNLRNAIAQVLGKARGAAITVADMQALDALYAANENIRNLTGLETATNLRKLGLEANSISDLSPISGLTNLTFLHLRNNSISNISHLAKLTQLTFLHIGLNRISNISPLAGLIQLTGLGAGDNEITDISPLTRLPNLARIGLHNNAISNISHLAGLTQLKELYLHNNTISDITPLSGLTQLTVLYLQENSISDLSPLVINTGLGNGDYVDVRENPLSALSFHTHIPTLQSRGIVIEFDEIAPPPQTVNIPDPNLRNAITQVLRKAPDATITVADMETLTALIATNRNITDLTGIEAATKLTLLDLRDNSISNLSPLAGLTNLTALWLARNNITDISPLARLTNLVLLYLEHNSITDLSPLVTNTGLGNGDYVDVRENPLNALSTNTHIPALQSRGVNVEFDDIVVRSVDVNGDGVVNIFDLVSAVSRFGKQGQNIAADVNGDGTVNIFDLVVIAGMFDGAAAAPSGQPQVRLTATEVRGWLTGARSLEIKDPIMKRGIMVLEQLLLSLTPTETQLLPNYPNPFNPETWIPYRLAEDAFVTLTIYDEAGRVVRTLEVGHQAAAIYENQSQAIYWDGRNQIGETVTSGVYFYHLSAGDYSATRKMLILK